MHFAQNGDAQGTRRQDAKRARAGKRQRTHGAGYGEVGGGRHKAWI